MVVVCADVRDPGNAGTVIRTADAAGVDAVVCCDGTVDPTNPKTVRASAGSVFHTPIVMGGAAAEVVATLHGHGFATLGTVARDGEDYTRFDWTRRVAVVLGNEAAGLDDHLVGVAGRPDDHPHGRPGRIAERRRGGRRAVLRGPPAAPGGGGGAVGLYDSGHGCTTRGRTGPGLGRADRDRPVRPGQTGRDESDLARQTDQSPQPDIEALVAEAGAAIAEAGSVEEIREVAVAVTGKKSPLARAQRSLGSLDEEARRELGRRINEGRAAVEDLLERRRTELTLAEMERSMRDDAARPLGVPPRGPAASRPGVISNLVTQTRDALEDVFVGMGFEVAEGPEIESDWYNFGALNIPPAHPARGMWDTFYLDLGAPESTLLRTHTSPVQIHLMERAVADGTLPIHAVMPGRCYRRDTPDARHLPIFHQIEGLVVDRGITFADLAGTIEVFTAAYFGPDIHSRLRPAYFPFTEPSAEFEVTCTICHGDGCRTCSQTGWIELGGCGMVDPAVFESVGIDPDVWTGFAFGFGIDRCAQMRHQIADMRALNENDIRFLRQF